MKYYISLSFLLITMLGFAQSPIDSTAVANDSTSLDYKKRGFFDIFEGKPGKAALYSLVLPGAGQAYNRRWWKVPIALGVEGFFIYKIVDKRNNFRRLDSKWRNFLATGVPPTDCDFEYTTPDQINSDRVDAREEMEYSWVYWGIAHIIVTLEAFVNRHLLEFDVSEDLSFKYKMETIPTPGMNPVPSFGLQMSF